MSEEFINYMEYLYVNNLTLDSNGNEVPLEKEKTLELSIKDNEDE